MSSPDILAVSDGAFGMAGRFGIPPDLSARSGGHLAGASGADAALASMRRSCADRCRSPFNYTISIRVLELGKSVPAAVAKDPWLRYHMAFARAICGDRTAAIAEFEELSHDAPVYRWPESR